MNPWRAFLKTRTCPQFPSVPEVRYKPLRIFAFQCRIHCDEEKFPLIKAFRGKMSYTLTKMYQTVQWENFSMGDKYITLRDMRGGWYHDRLLHEKKDPYMRIIRKCRLGRSELASHSFYNNIETGKRCCFCNQNKIETLNHFFFECPRFCSQRSQFLKNVNPLFKKLGLPQNHVSSCLGFNPQLVSNNYRKNTRAMRSRLYDYTCDFLRQSQRFKFV